MLASVSYGQQDKDYSTCFATVTRSIPDKYNTFLKDINAICALYQKINNDSYKIIDDPNLINNYKDYVEVLPSISDNLIVLNKYMKQIAIDHSISDNLRNNLDAILNRSLRSYYTALDSNYRVQYKNSEVGSFLTGSVGYIQQLGQDNYLSIKKEPERIRIPLKLRITAPYLNKKDKVRCDRGVAVSFENDFNYKNFFDNNQVWLILNESKLDLISKMQIESNDETVFCIERSGDGFRLGSPGDYFIDNAADGFTKDMNTAGTFIFQPEMKELDFERLRSRGNFKLGSYGYLRLVENNKQIDNYLRFKPIEHSYYTTDKVKFKIIDPLTFEVDGDICHSQLIFSLQIVDSAISEDFSKVLTHNGRKLIIKSKSNILNLRDRKDATFCLENKGDFFRIKNLYGFYVDDQTTEKDNNININAMTNLPQFAGVFDFVHSYTKATDFQQGDVGSFIINQDGYIKLQTDKTDEHEYINQKSLEKIDYSKSNEELSGQIVEPIRFNIVAPKLASLTNVCSESKLAVSFEFAHEQDYLLGRDEWSFKKVYKYDHGVDASTTFCIEKIYDNYVIKSGDGYYIDDTATGFTKNKDKYGKYLFVDRLTKSKDTTHIDVGPFQDQDVGYIKSTDNEIYLNIKNSNNNHYSLNEIEINSVVFEDTDLMCANDSGINILNSNNELLTNYYGHLYFLNRNMILPKAMTTFCVRKAGSGYVLYSDFNMDNRLYISKFGNSLTNNFSDLGKFTLINKLPSEKFVNNFQQGDVGLFRINSKGYLKLYNKNIYVNVEQYKERYNNKKDIPIMFNIIEPFGRSNEWCPNSMAISLEDAYDNTKVLGYNATNLDLSMINKTTDEIDKFGVFCLEHSDTGAHYRLRNKDGFYIDNLNARQITDNKLNIGEFLLYDRPLDLGVGSYTAINEINGVTMMFRDANQNSLFLSEGDNLLDFSDDILQSIGFEIIPGLADDNCFSLKDKKTSKFLVNTDSIFILLDETLAKPLSVSATFCPVVEPFNHTMAMYVYNKPSSYLAMVNNILTVASPAQTPLDNPQYALELVNKREATKVRQLPLQKITNVNCINHAQVGEKVGTEQRTVFTQCPTIQNLRETMKNDIQSYDDNQECCTGISFRSVSALYPQEGNTKCLINFDLICSE